jgi:hypothetical protein
LRFDFNSCGALKANYASVEENTTEEEIRHLTRVFHADVLRGREGPNARNLPVVGRSKAPG